MSEAKTSCAWVGANELYKAYHDKEWGVPCYNDHQLFEMLCLEGQQAGLSWITILQKRENFRKAFAHFEVAKLVRFTDKMLDEILLDKGIIRNRLKVYAIRANAIAYQKVLEEYPNFQEYIWQFVNGQPIKNKFENKSQVPAHSPESHAMSKDLKKRGFKFVGPTICYAYMQAAGMVNDHTTDCFRYSKV